MTGTKPTPTSNYCAECSRLHALLLQIRMAWRYEENAKIGQLIADALDGHAPETDERYSQAYADQMRKALLTIATSSLTPDRVRQFAHKGLLRSFPVESSPEKANEPSKPWTMGGSLVGTSRQGLAPFPYSRIVEVFGEPTEVCTEPGARCAFNWTITFADGTIVSIYEYKSSSLYGDGDDAPTPEQMKVDFTDWHIGGHRDSKAVEHVLNALNGNPTHE